MVVGRQVGVLGGDRIVTSAVFGGDRIVLATSTTNVTPRPLTPL